MSCYKGAIAFTVKDGPENVAMSVSEFNIIHDYLKLVSD
jgi:hypothetical protein